MMSAPISAQIPSPQKIDGNAATQIGVNVQNGLMAIMFTAVSSAHTTGDIAVTTTAGNNPVGPVIDIYTLNGLSSTVAVGGNGAGSASGTTATASIGSTLGGFIIAAGIQQTKSATTNTFSGTESPYTTDHSNFAISGFSAGAAGHAAVANTTGSNNVTMTWNATAVLAMVAGAWR
jgi:hypothetical protein